MPSLRLIAALSTQSDLSQPVVILAIALGLAGLAILLLFAKGKI
ncbi:MAG TPA: hypothetical protein VND40_04245 [Nitrososphaerales archaeon]|nr:hypothetical protein [Nitrososphaerales archaeon]